MDMKVTLKTRRALDEVRAAMWLACNSWSGGRLQLRRLGNALEIVGTDNFTLFRGVEKCVEFEGWEDGKTAKTCATGEALRVLRKLKRLQDWPDDFSICIEVKGPYDTLMKVVICESPYAETRTELVALNCNDIDVDQLLRLEPEPGQRNIHVARDVLHAIHKLGEITRTQEWGVRAYGDLKAFTLESAQTGDLIVAMPCRHADKEES